jgi:two-component system sensor histidine kinase YesM
MAERIDSLVSRELKQKILVNQANFKHLQAQINPHFMYNSYFLLYRMMKNGDKEGSLLVCENLGKFFKYINRDSGENKSLAEEIAHARSYAIIQGYRYQHIIQIDFPELPEKYGYIEVPRLIIQPLIENVFKYVVSDLDDEEEIKLRVHYEETEEHLIVCVENSGEITEEQLGLIKNKLTNQEEQEDITALMNISSRLNVLFRQEDSVMVSKSKMGGLKIELRLKL